MVHTNHYQKLIYWENKNAMWTVSCNKLLVRLFFVITLLSIACGSYSQTSTAEMSNAVQKKVKFLNGKVLTQSMFVQANTIYVINADFTLKDNITIPAGCTLLFEGGSISNGIITFQNTYINSGYESVFANVSFKGTISNDSFNALWIKAKDVGECINKASECFDKIYVPYNNYTFITPIYINGAQKLDLEGVYTYDGNIKNGLALITLDKCGATKLNVGTVTISDRVKRSMDYRDNRTKNVIGVNLKNTGSSRLYVRSVRDLNEGIRISCTDTPIGGGDNFVDANLLWNNNIGIRIYQQNSDKIDALQFVNDTHIRVNYCTSRLNATKYGVFIGGPVADNESYRLKGVADKYDQCNGVVIDGGDYEDLDVGFYCRNTEISIENAREERIPVFIKAVGSLKLHYQPKYQNAINKIDLSECSKFVANGLPAYASKFERVICPVTKRIKNKSYICKYNYYIMNSEGISSDLQLSSEVVGIGYIVSKYDSKIIRVESERPTRFIVAYLDAKNNNISKYFKKTGDDFFLTTSKVFASNVDTRSNTIIVPENVKRLFIGVLHDQSENKVAISSFTTMELDDCPTALSGSKRPEALPAGVAFFDKKLNKPIWWSGDVSVGDNGWVDANGKHPSSK